MKTAEEILVYMERELIEAHEQHEQFKGQDAQQAYVHLIRATTIQNLIEGIKAVEDQPEEKPNQFPIGHLEEKLMNGEITEEELVGMLVENSDEPSKISLQKKN